MAGMDGMVNASLAERAERTYRDVTTYRGQHPGVDVDDPRALTIAVAELTTRSVVGYLLMQLRRKNEDLDSLQLERFIDDQAKRAGLTSVTSYAFGA